MPALPRAAVFPSTGSTSRNVGGVAAVETQRLGYGGFNPVAAITGLHPETICRGRDERAKELAGRPADRVRLASAVMASVNRTPSLSARA